MTEGHRDDAASADAGTLLLQATEMPYGEARTLATEKALRVAEQTQDYERIFDVLAELIPTYRFAGEPAKSLASFARLVSAYDAGYGEPEEAARTLRWYYKWTISAMLDYPEFSLERISGALDEMERRYVAHGQSLHSVYLARYRVARHRGDTEAADGWYAKSIASLEDENADCEGCTLNTKVAHLKDRGRDEEAIELAAPVLAEWLRCREQPHGILTSLLFPYVRTGRYEQAVDAHRRAYRVHRNEPSDLTQIGTHVRFCALTGNEPRGLEIVERHLPWLDRYTTPDDANSFAEDAALLLRRLPRATTVRTSGVVIGSEHHELADRTEAGELADRLVAWAYEIGARFDERNGNTTYTDGTTRALQSEPLVDYLPLFPHSRIRPTAAAGAEPVTEEDRGSTPENTALPGTTVPGDTGSSAEAGSRTGSTGTSGGGAEPGRDGSQGESPATPRDRVTEHVARGRSMLRSGRPEEALPDLAEAVAELTAMGGAARAVQPDLGELWLDLGGAYLESGRPMDAAETLEQALGIVRSEASTSGTEVELAYDVRRARHLVARAQLELHETDSALGELDSLVRVEQRLGNFEAAASLLEMAADALARRYRDDEAASRFADAARMHERTGDLVRELRCRRNEMRTICKDDGDLIDAAGRAHQAHERVERVLDERGHELGDRLAGERALLSEAWGEVLDTLDRDEEAAQQYASSVELHAAVDDVEGMVRCRRRQGKSVFFAVDDGDEEQALPLFEQARVLLRERGAELDEYVREVETARVEFDTAWVLDHLKRFDEAQSRCESAIEIFDRIGAEREGKRARSFWRSIG